jgi:hypothetical protein
VPLAAATVFIPAVLAFAAAILGSLLAYRQWKKQRSVERGKSFDADRATAYKELWSRLEAIHLRLRAADVRGDDFEAAVRDLNAFILGSEIYFEPGIQARAKAYVEAARNVSVIIKSQPADVRRDYEMTESDLIDVNEMNALAAALKAAEESRNSIMAEVRANIGADA